MVVLYVLDVPEFMPIIDAARARASCSVTKSNRGYYKIESPTEIILNRREMKMKPAVWYGIFTGGINGEIAEFGREEVRLIGTNKRL
jgi:hypothetical protein